MRWENLWEILWVLKDTASLDLPPAAKKVIDLEGRAVKDGRAITDRQIVLAALVHAICEYPKGMTTGSGGEQGDWSKRLSSRCV